MRWKRQIAGMMLVVALVAAAQGCGQDPDCAAAAEKLEACGLGDFNTYYDLESGTCEETDACIADCVNTRSCSALESTIATGMWYRILCAEVCPQFVLFSGPR